MRTEDNLRATLARLEVLIAKTLETRGYAKDAKSLRILEEMIREQLTHANSRSATRTIR